MKERPILFSAPMVRAILEGRKTQTRRVLKHQPIRCTELPVLLFPRSRNESIKQSGFIWPNAKEQILALCPHGNPRDRLWVRETWQGPLIDEELEEEFCQSPDYFKKPTFCKYRATDTLDAINSDGEELGWRPSIHMPRWASRIILEITGVRVERLQDINEADARDEGVTDGGCLSCGDHEPCGCTDPKPDARDSFCRLWQSINGEESWHANPWVWVVEFKRIGGEA